MELMFLVTLQSDTDTDARRIETQLWQVERSYGKSWEVMRSYGTIVLLHTSRYFRKNKRTRVMSSRSSLLASLAKNFL
jgi:hypothetical protein